MQLPRPFCGLYAPSLTIALAALVPYILTTSGGAFYADMLHQDLGLGRAAQSLVSALSTAGYAFGALWAGDMVQRIPQRRLFLICIALQALGWIVTALAPGPFVFAVGHILAGSVTGMLLVIALPPTIRRFSAERLPFTAVFINIGLFGGVAGGPLLGSVIASGSEWRWLFGSFALVSLATLVLALLTLEDQEPMKPDLPRDRSALLLGAGAAILPFAAAGLLAFVGFASPAFIAPLALGLLCFAALLFVEYRKDEPLVPVERMWSTFPMVGTIAATVGGAAFVTLLQLTTARMLQAEGSSPVQAGLSFWPMLVGACLAAGLLGLLLRTRFLPLLVFGAMLVLILAGALLTLPGSDRDPLLMPIAIGLLGLGAGGSVAPGLFLSGLSLPVATLGRIVALIELVRSVGDFILAPVMLKVARSGGASSASLDAQGAQAAMVVTLLVAVAGLALVVLLYLAGTRRFQRPDIAGWMNGEGDTALRSPPLFARLRGAQKGAARTSRATP